MYQKNHFLEYFLIVTLLFIVAKSAESEELPLTLNEISQGSLLVNSGEQGKYQKIPIQKTDVVMNITGPIARTKLIQTFVNPDNTWLEAIYAFPLPEDAAVDHLDMRVGDRVIQGLIKEKQQARKIYQQAKNEGKRTALVEQQRPNLFTMSVANIPPHGKVEIQLEYQQTLKWRDQQFSVRFPLAITPRYMLPAATSAIQRVEVVQQVNAGWSILPGEIPNVIDLASPSEEPDQSARVDIHISLEAGFPLEKVASRYHDIKQIQKDDGTVEIRLASSNVKADRDFVLEWNPEAQAQPKAAFFTEQSQKGSFGLLMVMPPLLDKENTFSPRETLFIIDTSGSMGGESIRQARAALIMAIDRLQPHDSFNVVEFNSLTRVLFNQPRQATEANKAIALSQVEKLQAGGGTEMLPALKTALSMPTEFVSSLRQIIFITDGAVGNEAELLTVIQVGLGNSRLFTVGIGSAPNSYFMTEAAHFGRGTHTFVSKPNEVREKMQQLFLRLEQPVLTDLVLKVDGETELLPDPLPDLYAGEPLVVVMKMSSPVTQAELTARLDAVEWKQQLTLSEGKQQSGLDIYWGREKIHQWMRAGIKGVAADKIREEVVTLALHHHLVSQFTSLVAVDVTPVRAASESLKQHAIKGERPAGLSVNPVISQEISMANSATHSLAYLLIGIILLLLAMAWNYSKNLFRLVY